MPEAAVLTTRIAPEIKRRLGELADNADRSTSYLAAKAIEEYVERHSWRLQAIVEAKAEATKGQFVSQASMKSWVNSLGTDSPLSPPEVDIHNTKT